MIAILTGPVGSGKTTYLASAVPLLRASGTTVDGYLSLRIMDGASILGYDLEDLRTGEIFPLLRTSCRPEGETVGPFTVVPAGFEAARAVIGRGREPDVLIIDELGRLELSGRGVWPAAGPVLADAGRRVLAVIREELLDKYLALFKTSGAAVAVIRLPASKDPDILVKAVEEGRP